MTTPNESNKSEMLQLRVTPKTKWELESAYADDHRPNMESALNQALRLYISPYRHLFATMKNGVDCQVQTKEEYLDMKHAYDAANDLYTTLTRIEDNSYNCHLNAIRDVLRDYVIIQLQNSVHDYEKTHYKEIDDDDFISFMPWLEIPDYSEYGEDDEED